MNEVLLGAEKHVDNALTFYFLGFFFLKIDATYSIVD